MKLTFKLKLQQLFTNLFTVVKLGEEGAAYLEHSQFERIGAPIVPVVDTVGAGDTFNAAFIYGLQLGATRREAIGMAIQAASTTISSNPRRYASPEDLTASGGTCPTQT